MQNLQRKQRSAEWGWKSPCKCDILQKKVLKFSWSRSEPKAIQHGALAWEPLVYKRKRLDAGRNMKKKRKPKLQHDNRKIHHNRHHYCRRHHHHHHQLQQQQLEWSFKPPMTFHLRQSQSRIFPVAWKAPCPLAPQLLSALTNYYCPLPPSSPAALAPGAAPTHQAPPAWGHLHMLCPLLCLDRSPPPSSWLPPLLPQVFLKVKKVWHFYNHVASSCQSQHL